MPRPYLPTAIQAAPMPTAGVRSPMPTAFDRYTDLWFATLDIEVDSTVPVNSSIWLSDATGSQVNTAIYYQRGLHRWLTRTFNDYGTDPNTPPAEPWGIVDHQDASTLLPTFSTSGNYNTAFGTLGGKWNDPNTHMAAWNNTSYLAGYNSYPADMNFVDQYHWMAIGEAIASLAIQPYGGTYFTETVADLFDYPGNIAVMANYLAALDLYAVWRNPAAASLQGYHTFNRFDGSNSVLGIKPSDITQTILGPDSLPLPWYDGQIYPTSTHGGALYAQPNMRSFPNPPGIVTARKRCIDGIQMGDTALAPMIDTRSQVMAGQNSHYIIAEFTSAKVEGGAVANLWRKVAEGIQSGGSVLEIGGPSLGYNFPATISTPVGTAVTGNMCVAYIAGYQTLEQFVATYGGSAFGHYVVTHY